ncbi:hypothetical protein CsSME_00005227 [Camellia sinensis var. sinensis]
MKESNAWPAVKSTSSSMCGRGKLSFGLVLFRSLKSTPTRILPSFFGTGTMLANQVGYSDTSKNPVSICLVTSSLIFKAQSGRILRSFCLMGRALGSRGIRCYTISGSILNMSS